jgi:hypothetical protein
MYSGREGVSLRKISLFVLRRRRASGSGQVSPRAVSEWYHCSDAAVFDCSCVFAARMQRADISARCRGITGIGGITKGESVSSESLAISSALAVSQGIRTGSRRASERERLEQMLQLPLARSRQCVSMERASLSIRRLKVSVRTRGWSSNPDCSGILGIVDAAQRLGWCH